MKRRTFISLLSGAVVGWPLAARVQQADRMRRTGVLVPFSANDPQSKARLSAFQQGLQKLGWADGRNVWIDVRWFAGSADDNRKNGAELVALAPDVILASGSATVAPSNTCTLQSD